MKLLDLGMELDHEVVDIDHFLQFARFACLRKSVNVVQPEIVVVQKLLELGHEGVDLGVGVVQVDDGVREVRVIRDVELAQKVQKLRGEGHDSRVALRGVTA